MTTRLRHLDPGGNDPEMLLAVRPGLQAPGLARAFVRTGVQLLGSEPSERSENAVLLTSEAVTNSVEHADTDAVEIRLERHGELIRVAVTDDDPAVPELQPEDPTVIGGFGLHIIDLLADGWGVDVVSGDGKCVWFEITLPMDTSVLP